MLRFARRKWEWTAASLNADVRNTLPDENGNGGNQEPAATISRRPGRTLVQRLALT